MAAANDPNYTAAIAALAKAGLTLAKISSIQPGTVVSANGAILRQSTGLAVPVGAGIDGGVWNRQFELFASGRRRAVGTVPGHADEQKPVMYMSDHPTDLRGLRCSRYSGGGRYGACGFKVHGSGCSICGGAGVAADCLARLASVRAVGKVLHHSSVFATKRSQFLSDLQTYMALPKPRAESAQAAALAIFDSLWAGYEQQCATVPGAAGANCVADRQAGACHYQANGAAGIGS